MDSVYLMPTGSQLKPVTMTTSIYLGHRDSKIPNKSELPFVLLPGSLGASFCRWGLWLARKAEGLER